MKRKSKMPKDPRFIQARRIGLLFAIKDRRLTQLREWLKEFKMIIDNDIAKLVELGFLEKKGHRPFLTEQGKKLVESVSSERKSTQTILKGSFLERRRKMEKTIEYRWFIEPLDATTNLIVYQALEELSQSTQPTKIVDAQGTLHEVWEVNYPFIRYIQKSKNLHSTSFNAYNQTGDIIRRWRLHEIARKKSKKKAAKGGPNGSKR